MKIYLIEDKDGKIKINFSSYMERLFSFLEDVSIEELISNEIVEAINYLVDWIGYEATLRERFEIPCEVTTYERITLIRSKDTNKVRIEFLNNNPILKPNEEIIGECSFLAPRSFTNLIVILRRYPQIIGNDVIRGLNELVEIIWESLGKEKQKRKKKDLELGVFY